MLLWYIDWWWDGMHADTLCFVRNCPVCLTVSGGGKLQLRPPLNPIPVQSPHWSRHNGSTKIPMYT